MSKLYAERDIIEQGNYYSRHTSAMTGEGLHSKSDIAAELAHRDIQVEKLKARVAELESHFSKRPNVHDNDMRVKYAQWADGLQVSRTSAWLLRKQAEAVERLYNECSIKSISGTYIWSEGVINEVQRLRQKADELEQPVGSNE